MTISSTGLPLLVREQIAVAPSAPVQVTSVKVVFMLSGGARVHSRAGEVSLGSGSILTIPAGVACRGFPAGHARTVTFYIHPEYLADQVRWLSTKHPLVGLLKVELTRFLLRRKCDFAQHNHFKLDRCQPPEPALAREAETETPRAADLVPGGDDPTRAVDVGRLREVPEDVIQIVRSNPQIYYRGRIFKVPTHLVGTYQLVTTATSFTMFSVLDGEESIYFPKPVRVASSKRLVPFWQVYGARIRDPRPAWTSKRIAYEKEHYSSDTE